MSQQATEQVPNQFSPAADTAETTSAEGILVAAYMVLWLILMVFVGLSYRRQRATSARLDEIERALAARSGSE